MVIGTSNRHARTLRRNATEVEAKLWRHVRNRQLAGYKFRRQATVGFHVADFLCAEKRLIVELDGGQHDEVGDLQRTTALERLGFRVVRFWNNEVNENLHAVLDRIVAECEARPSRFKPKDPSSNSG